MRSPIESQHDSAPFDFFIESPIQQIRHNRCLFADNPAKSDTKPRLPIGEMTFKIWLPEFQNTLISPLHQGSSSLENRLPGDASGLSLREFLVSNKDLLGQAARLNRMNFQPHVHSACQWINIGNILDHDAIVLDPRHSFKKPKDFCDISG